MKLTNRKSYMTSLAEGQAPESSKPKITQSIYFFALTSIVAYLIYIFGLNFFYFSEIGFVEVEKITLSSSRGGRIKSLTVSEGEHLKKNKLIAVIINKQSCTKKEDARLDKLFFDIAFDKMLLDSIIMEIAQTRENIINDELQRALELGRDLLINHKTIQQEILKLNNEAQLIKNQLHLKQTRLKKLRGLNALMVLPKECFNETISYPSASTVYSIQKQAYEVVTPAESILTLIANNAPVRIDVYLDMDDFISVVVGDIVNIEFSDGYQDSAEVESILSSAYNRPQRKLDQYKPLRTHVRVSLKPVNEQQALIWKQFDQMEVKVRGRK